MPEEARSIPLEEVTDQATFKRLRNEGRSESTEDDAPPVEPTGKEEMKEFKAKREGQIHPGRNVEKRIDRLIKERSTLREEVARLKAGEQADPDEPSPEQIQEHKRSEDRFKARMEELRTKHADFDEVSASAKDIELPQSVLGHIVSLENGSDVALWLARHPQIARELKAMPFGKAMQRLDRLSGRLEAEEESAEPKEEKPARKAPEPIKPVGNGNTRSSIPLHEMEMDAFKKARKAGRVQ
jgi:hypothetical protein